MIDVIASIVGWATPIVTLLSILGVYYSIRARFEKTERGERMRHAENALILKALFACLDGLHQQGCNGAVTKCHKELENYLIEKRE